MKLGSHRYVIKNTADITHAIIDIQKYSSETGFDDTTREAIKTVVSELCYNIVKYASKGELIVNRVKSGNKKGIEIKAKDQGPGIADIEVALQENFSTGKTLGLGLPGVKRLMDEIEIESELNRGTTVVVRKWLGS